MQFAHLFRLALLCSALAFITDSSAQCPGCVPDSNCTADPAFPTLCPLNPPDGTAGQPYQADFTFWLPETFTDAGSGLTVTFQQMTITGVSGLPFGLIFEASSPTLIYYPQQNQYGCARICGIPAGAGTYSVTISILAAVSVSGIDLDVPQEFVSTLIIQPGETNNGFSLSASAGCGSLTTTFQALIDASPAPTSYAWDFGNGNSSTVASPPSQTYTQVGTHTITLQTTIGGYVLNTVALTNVNGNWCGDVEEPNIPFVGCTGSPDPYFVLTNSGGGTYTSSTVDNSTAASWSGLGLLLDSPPYSIAFFDEDAVSTDDLLGTYNIPANGAGTYAFNVAGGTAGSLQISNEPQQVFLDTDSVIVHPLPDVMISVVDTLGTICAGDTTLTAYAWFHDGIEVLGAEGPCTMPTGPGLWQAVGTTEFGCSDTSNTIVVCPVFEILRNGNVLFVPGGYVSYAWTYEGVSLGSTDAFVLTQGDGLYTVTVEDVNGCVIELSYLLDTVGIDDAEATGAQVVVFPVPNNGSFTVMATGLSAARVQLEVLDVAGRPVHKVIANAINGKASIPVSIAVSAGTYFVRVNDEGQVRVLRTVVQ